MVSNGKLVWMGKTWSFVERRILCPTALVPQPGNYLFALSAKSRLIPELFIVPEGVLLLADNGNAGGLFT